MGNDKKAKHCGGREESLIGGCEKAIVTNIGHFSDSATIDKYPEGIKSV